MKTQKKYYRKGQSGFSLIELLVVVAIFVIMSGVVLFNQSKFSSDISITNVTFAVAQQVRQAQVYGMLVRKGADQNGDPNFNSAYGIHISNSDGPSGVTLQLYEDVNGDYEYDPGSGKDNPIGGATALKEGNKITSFCTYPQSAVPQCYYADSGIKSAITYADIVYKRPEPAAHISDSSGDTGLNQLIITIQSALGDKTRTVTITSSGQISVK